MNKLLSKNINRIWSSLIINEFLKNKITHFYISPGMRNAPLIAALVHAKKFNSELKIIICMDERAAGYRALGFAKATGIPAVLICTSGTAMANYMPSVVEAQKSHLPMIILSADRPQELTSCDDNQAIDQTKFFKDYVQGEMNLGAPSIEIGPLVLTSSLSNLIHKSFFPQKGPVHFNCPFREPLEDISTPIPKDYLDLATLQINREGPSTRYMNLNTIPTNSDLKEFFNLLTNSKTGLLVIGSLNPHDDIKTIVDFIKLLNWPTYFDISSSLKYKFNLNDNTIPTFDHPEVQEALITNPPETVFHIGGRLTSKHYYSFLKQVPSINLITLSLNKEKEDPSHHTKMRINADIFSTINAINNMFTIPLPEKKINLNFESFALKKVKLIDDGPLSYPLISKTIVDNAIDHSIFYIGNSTIVRSFDAYFSYSNKKNITIATNRGVSGIEGFIASSCGFIDGIQKELYVIIGDIAFIHDLNSLYFLRELKIPLKIILVNNNSGGIFTLLPISDEKEVLNYITSPHNETFKKMADLIDIDYIEVRSKDLLIPSLQKFQKNKNHCLMEIFVDNGANKKIYEQLRTIKL